MTARILFVDDDKQHLAMNRQAFGESYGVETAENVAAAFKAIETRGPYAAIVSDMNMPQMSGVQLFEELQKKAPDTVRIMVTGEAKETAIEAVNRGHVFRFLTKPCRHSELRAAIEAAVLHYRLVCSERDLLDKTLRASVKVLSEILSMTAPAIFGRTEKLRRHLRQFHKATKLGVQWQLDVAAMLAPIGLVTLPGNMLLGGAKSGKRSAAEEALYATVPRIGHKLVADIPRMEVVAQVILYQNQRYDGWGSPNGDDCRGESIPLGARILKVLGDLISLEADGTSVQGAFAEMQKRQPGCYDPKILMTAQEVFAPGLVARVDRESIQLHVHDLKPGHVLAAPIRTTDGVLIVGAGAEITEVLLSRLLNFCEIGGLRLAVEVDAESAQHVLALNQSISIPT